MGRRMTVYHTMGESLYDSIPISSGKQYLQVSPGSNERMTGWSTVLACFLACLFLELSQQPTWPQVKHSRRCTHSSPDFRHSSQPVGVLGVVAFTYFFKCSQGLSMLVVKQFRINSYYFIISIPGSSSTVCVASRNIDKSIWS